MKLWNKINKEELKASLSSDKIERTTLSFYKYARISNTQIFRDHLYIHLEEIGVLGRIYLAHEGINAQISVPSTKMEAFRAFMDTIDFLKGIRLNIAIDDDGQSFYLLKIKIRNKIVADGLDDSSFDVTDGGIHIDAKRYNELVEDKETVVVDMRNHYESEVGHFENAITPDVETFRESLPIVDDMLKEHKEKNIIMYCTGGIRCEKASAYLKHQGYKNVHQLDGGIIEYARQVKEQELENNFKGKNFVFDDRLGERISKDIISKCHQCGAANDNHTNCSNDACHLLFIQCDSCKIKFSNACSIKCRDYNALSVEERKNLKGSIVFNGSKFGKGRYKAQNNSGLLEKE